MPSSNTYLLTWVSLTLDVRYLFTAAPPKCSCYSFPWTSGVSSQHYYFFFLSTSLLSAPSPFLIHNYFSGCLGASHMYSHTVSSFLNGFYYFFFSSPPYNNSTNNSGACVNFVEILTKPLHSGRSNQCHLVLTFA